MEYLNSQKGIAPIIAVLVLAVIFAGFGGVYYLKQYQAKQVLTSTIFKLYGTEVTQGRTLGMAIVEGSDESNGSIKVFALREPNTLVTIITSQDIVNAGGPDSNDEVVGVRYSPVTHQFVIVTGSFTGGSLANDSWNISVYNEETAVLKYVLSEDGMGSSFPDDIVLSPLGRYMAYTSGFHLGWCGSSFGIEGVDLVTLQPFSFEGDVHHTDAPIITSLLSIPTVFAAGPPEPRERPYSPINDKTSLYAQQMGKQPEQGINMMMSFGDLKWKDENAIAGTYSISTCDYSGERNETNPQSHPTQKFEAGRVK